MNRMSARLLPQWRLYPSTLEGKRTALSNDRLNPSVQGFGVPEGAVVLQEFVHLQAYPVYPALKRYDVLMNSRGGYAHEVVKERLPRHVLRVLFFLFGVT